MAMGRFKSPLILAWCALALILIVRGRALWALSDRLAFDPDDYAELATKMQFGNDYYVSIIANPWSIERLYAWRPPLYPGLLAAIIPRGTELFSFWVGCTQFALGVLTVIAVYFLSRQCSLANETAAIAAGLVLLDPILIHQSAEVMTETLAAFLVPICLIALVWASHSAHRTKSSMFAGAMIGTAILCRPTFLVWAVFVVTALGAIDIFQRRIPGRAMLLGLGLAVVVSPWLARNWAVLGEPIVTTTHGGYTFYRANNPLYYEHLRTSPWGTAWNTDQFDELWRAQMSRKLPALTSGNQNATSTGKPTEVLLDQISYEAGLDTIRNEPGMFVYASVVRLARLYGMVPWQTDPHESPRMRWLRYGIGAFYLCVFALAVVGMFALGRQLFAPPWLWATLLVLAFTLVHTFYWTDMRMRAPLVPVIAMVAAVGVERVWKRCRPPGAQASPGMAIPGLGVRAATL